MKKIIFTIALALPAIAAFPQTKNILMPSDLIMNYSVPVSSDIKETIYIPFGTEINPKKYLYCEVKMSSAISFGKYILEGITKNKVALYNYSDGIPGYDPIGKQMTAAEVIDATGQSIDTVTMWNDQGVKETRIIKKDAIKDELFTNCKFAESWFFDPIKYSMKKEVMQYFPCISVLVDDLYSENNVFKGWKMIGSLLSKNNSNANTKLLSIRYEFPLGNNDALALKILKPDLMDVPDNYSYTEKENCPFWNSYNRQKFLDALIDPVLNGKVKVTDYFSNAILDLETVRQRMGQTSDTLTMVNPLDPDRDTTFVITREPGIYDVLSLIFVEEWFINPQTLDIRKQVVAIAPVCWYYTTDPATGEIGFPKKQIAFLIKLN